ncbi:MAG: SufE family protein [Bacteroidales bacterium]|jgi:cysteine desulfuration protein SufE|nr:SufE family protein [Bacteroidales bacterium]
MSIQEKEKNIIAEISNYTDWMDKYNRIIDYGKTVPKIEDSQKTETNLIKGCQSRVWLSAELIDGKIYFKTDSDAVITKGIAALLISVYNGELPADILAHEPSFIEKIGLKEHLSPTRSNGLQSMLKQIKMYALAFKLKTTI